MIRCRKRHRVGQGVKISYEGQNYGNSIAGYFYGTQTYTTVMQIDQAPTKYGQGLQADYMAFSGNAQPYYYYPMGLNYDSGMRVFSVWRPVPSVSNIRLFIYPKFILYFENKIFHTINFLTPFFQNVIYTFISGNYLSLNIQNLKRINY